MCGIFSVMLTQPAAERRRPSLRATRRVLRHAQPTPADAAPSLSLSLSLSAFGASLRFERTEGTGQQQVSNGNDAAGYAQPGQNPYQQWHGVRRTGSPRAFRSRAQLEHQRVSRKSLSALWVTRAECCSRAAGTRVRDRRVVRANRRSPKKALKILVSPLCCTVFTRESLQSTLASRARDRRRRRPRVSPCPGRAR